MSGKQRATRAAELLEGVRRSSDPVRSAAGEIEWLERAAETAERWQAQEEEFLACAVELMRGTEHARAAATRAATVRARIEDDRLDEKHRRHKNALARERYAERRRTEGARVDKRTGMHALAIQVDPAAYRAVKAEALRRRATTMPRLIGEILRKERLRGDLDRCQIDAPRWRRTGGGRLAQQHTRVEIGEEDWASIHLDAISAGLTLARWIGRSIERWAASSSCRSGEPGTPAPVD